MPTPSPPLLRFGFLLCGAAIALSADRPNVVIIYGDDVGYGDVGAYGSTKIPTPHLDRLAAEGLRFTDGHCSASTCTPSRYSLLTGEMPFRKKGTGIARGDANMIISPDQFTLADVFQQSGYKTAVIGKWHLGLGDGRINWNEKIAPGPESLGFDHYFMIPATNDRTPCVYLENGHIVNLDPADPITVSYRGRIPDSVAGTVYPDARLQPGAITAYKGDGYHSATVINGLGRIGYQDGCEVRGSDGMDRGHDASGIYRGGKYQIHEGGTRVPFIVRWPGRVKPGISDALVSQVDLLASFAAMLDRKIPAGQAADSRNLLKTVLGEDPRGAEIILQHSRKSPAIRRHHWKYIDNEPQLYDLSKDPGETTNLIDRFPEIAKELGDLLDRCRTQPLRKHRPTGDR